MRPTACSLLCLALTLGSAASAVGAGPESPAPFGAAGALPDDRAARVRDVQPAEVRRGTDVRGGLWRLGAAVSRWRRGRGHLSQFLRGARLLQIRADGRAGVSGRRRDLPAGHPADRDDHALRSLGWVPRDRMAPRAPLLRRWDSGRMATRRRRASAASGEDVDVSKKGFIVFAGAEFRVMRWFGHQRRRSQDEHQRHHRIRRASRRSSTRPIWVGRRFASVSWSDGELAAATSPSTGSTWPTS